MALGDPYISRDDLKDVLGITATDENSMIDRYVAGATRAINNKSGYTTFWNTGTAVARVVSMEGRIVPKRGGSTPFYKLLLPDGIASASGFSIAGYPAASLLPADSFFEGKPAQAIKLPWGSSIGDLTITAIWGWPTLPEDIIMAAQFQAQRYYKRRGSPEGVAGTAEWGMATIPRLDPDVAAILTNGGYMNPGIG